MLGTPTTWVRTAIVGLLALLIGAFAISSAYSQHRTTFGGHDHQRFGGGVLGGSRPAIIIVAPTPNFGGFPGGFPAMPQPPANPGQPAELSGTPLYNWNCNQCGWRFGTGPTPPNISFCPRCRAQFNGSTVNGGVNAPPPQPPVAPQFPAPAPPVVPGYTINPPPGGYEPSYPTSAAVPELQPRATLPPIPQTNPAPAATSSPAATKSSPPDASGASSTSRSRVLKVVAVTVAGLFLAAAVGGFVLFAVTNRGQRVTRTRRRRVSAR